MSSPATRRISPQAHGMSMTGIRAAIANLSRLSPNSSIAQSLYTRATSRLEFWIGGAGHFEPEGAGVDHLRPYSVDVLGIQPVLYVPPLHPTLLPQLVLVGLLIRPHGHLLGSHPVLNHQALPVSNLDMRGLVPKMNRQSFLPE